MGSFVLLDIINALKTVLLPKLIYKIQTIPVKYIWQKATGIAKNVQWIYLATPPPQQYQGKQLHRNGIKME